jgi:uncharacterized protein YndB with AHSA1/START domain
MTDLGFSLERTVVIRARRATVFRYFTDSERFASWWGKGSQIASEPGGKVVIRYPNGAVAGGEVVEIVDGERIAFTYGYQDPEKPIPLGGSLVTITLRDVPGGTELHLRHDVADAATRDAHVGGWRFQLSLFANVAANEEHAGFAQRIAEWFAAWAEPELEARRSLFEQCTEHDVAFRDQFACVLGREELAAHVQAARMFMSGFTLRAEGEPRACQGTAIVDWVATASDSRFPMRGTNVVELSPEGKIRSVVGIQR